MPDRPRQPKPIPWDALEQFRRRYAEQGAEWAVNQTEWARRAGVAVSNFSNWHLTGKVTASTRTLAKLADAAGMPLGRFLAELEGEILVARAEPVLLTRVEIERLRTNPMQTVHQLVERSEHRPTFPHYALEVPRSETSGAIQIEDDAINLVAPPGSVAIIDWSDDARKPLPGAFYLIGVGEQILWRRYADGPPRWEPRTTRPDAHPTYPANGEIDVIAAVLHFVTPGRPRPFKKSKLGA